MSRRCCGAWGWTVVCAVALACGSGPAESQTDTAGGSTTGTSAGTTQGPASTTSTTTPTTSTSTTTSPTTSTTSTGADPVCGDGVVDPGEECDDGNAEGGDGCEPQCTLGPELVWCRDLPGTLPQIDVAPGGELVHAEYDGATDGAVTVLRLDPETGETLASATADYEPMSVMVTGPERVYVAHAFDTGADEFLVFDLGLDLAQLPGFGIATVYRLATDNAHVFSLSVDFLGNFGVSAYGHDGALTWGHYDDSGWYASGFVEGAGVLYVAGGTEYDYTGHAFVHRLDVTTGAPLGDPWELAMADESAWIVSATDAAGCVAGPPAPCLRVAGVARDDGTRRVVLASYAVDGALLSYETPDRGPTGDTTFPYDLDVHAATGRVAMTYDDGDRSMLGIRMTGADGRLLWQLETPGSGLVSSELTDDAVYVSWGSRLCRYSMDPPAPDP